MLEIAERNNDYITVVANGLLSHEDYELLVPQLEHAIETAGPLRLLIQLDDFAGWTPAALIDDLKFDLTHRHDFASIAVVGSGKLEKLGTQLARPFFSGQVQFFEDLTEAHEWLRRPITEPSRNASP